MSLGTDLLVLLHRHARKGSTTSLLRVVPDGATIVVRGGSFSNYLKRTLDERRPRHKVRVVTLFSGDECVAGPLFFDGSAVQELAHHIVRLEERLQAAEARVEREAALRREIELIAPNIFRLIQVMTKP